MIHILLIKYGWLLVAAFVSGLVDTIAGGGGLITVPALLLAGLPPAAALGTNKLQACFGSGTAAYRFIRLGQLRWQQIRFGILMTFIGSSLGTITIMLLHPAFLSKIIPILLAGALVYSLLSKKMSAQAASQAKWSPTQFFIIIGIGLGFYDGFFGPGTGSFWTIALVALLGMPLQRAVMHTKVYNFTSNLFSLLWFILGGHLAYTIGLVMAVGQCFGAYLGTYIVYHKGARWIRPVFIIMVLVMLIATAVKYY